ncbi:SRPBCC domain-containing protein [Flavihumibacter sp. R14]|nr:SRPBCC domain-containing protein [Flavihumibacter soli]
MEKSKFSVSINAPKEKVWKVLWDDSSYREWTRVFNEGSYAETDNWKEGSKVKFLSADGRDGMISEVAANRPNEFMSFRHLGVIKGGVEDTESDEVKQWGGATENYSLEEKDGIVSLKVDMDTTEEFKEYFDKTWPKALDRVKTLSEK